MIISPAKNLWHCPSCNKGGDVIRFVQDYDGVSFRHAVEFLRNGNLSDVLTNSQRVKQSTVPKLKTPVELNVEDQRQLQHVITYYHQRLLESEVAQEYLKKRGLWNPEAVKVFKLGYADRTLGLRLPERNRKNGTILREQLQRIGIYRDTGREHFNGCLVIPIIDENNRVTEIYGRKLSDKNLNKGLPSHLYLPGPHQGLWNPACLNSNEIILCEALIDALTFWVNGFRHVTASYGTAGFTSDHLAAFVDHRIGKVYIAYDRDEAGNNAAQKLAAQLSGEGIQCYRVNFPHCMDANSYARQVTPAEKALETLLRSAAFMGKKAEVKPSPSTPSTPIQAPEPGAAKEKAAKKEKSTIPVEQNGDDLLITLGDRRYRIRGLERNTSFDILKVNIRVNLGDFFHVDTLDLYNARHRKSYIHTAAEEIKADPEILKRDIGRILLKLEGLQEEKLKETLEVDSQKVELSDEEKQQALELLKSPRLLQQIANDFELVGLVGERSNALVAYLAAVSRKTDDPLAIIIQSSSSAGKSSLMDAVLDFVAAEDLIRYTAMTGQSLFYTDNHPVFENF